MGVYGFEAIIVAYDNDISVSSSPAYHADDAVECSKNGISSVNLEVDTCMGTSVSSSISRKKSGSGKGKKI